MKKKLSVEIQEEILKNLKNKQPKFYNKVNLLMLASGKKGF